MMEFYKSTFKTVLFAIIMQISIASCAPSEQMLEISLEQQRIGVPFSFAEYCKETYDSIYLIFPYDSEEGIQRLPYRMSKSLRNESSCTLDDTYTTVLFIRDGVVEAYSRITYDKAVFSPPALPEDIHIYPFDQQFVISEEKYKKVSLYR